MSKYSGKCDFYDFLSINGEGKEYNVRKNDGTVIEKNDFPKYYAHLVSTAGCCEKSCNVTLCNDSYPDQREREYFTWLVKLANYAYRRCKRKKLDADETDRQMRDHVNGPFEKLEDDVMDAVICESLRCKGKDDRVDVKNILEKGFRYKWSEYYRVILEEDIEKDNFLTI